MEQEFLSSQSESFFETESASVGQRFLNYLIDLVVLYVVAFGMGLMLALASYASGETLNNGFQEALLLFTIFLGVFYYAFVEGASRGRSIGKLITRTKVVKDDGSEISWKDAFVRSLCRMIPFEPFTAFNGYPLHDRLSHTKVIKLKK